MGDNVFFGKKGKVIEKRNLSLGEKTKIQDGVYIDALSWGQFGNSFVFDGNSTIEYTDRIQCIGKRVKIGKRTIFGNDCVFSAAGGI